MTTQIADALAAWRSQLTDAGFMPPPSSQHFRDQAQASFRLDLLSLGIDPAEPANLAAALAGFVTATKPLIQQDLPLPLLAQFVGLCEVLLPMLSSPPVDVTALPDLSFMDSITLPDRPEPAIPDEELCQSCHTNQALAEMPDGALLCIPCARNSIIQKMVERMRESGMVISFDMPTIGGPGFQRGPDQPRDDHGRFVAKKRWQDMTVAELFGRKGKHRRRHGQD